MNIHAKPSAIVPLTKRDRKGLFISFEGIEGCGKTTQCHHLAQSLRNRGYRVIETREPGGTLLSEQIRDLFLKPTKKNRQLESLTPQCEAHLILACRSQHVAQVIIPGLLQGAILLCDRFIDSTLAYQGYGRGLNLEKLKQLNRWATGGLLPDCTFWLDVPVSQGLKRRLSSTTHNRLDRESRAFHTRVQQGFRHLAEQAPGRIMTLDGRLPAETIAQQVAHKVDALLSRLTPYATASTRKRKPQPSSQHRTAQHHAIQ